MYVWPPWPHQAASDARLAGCYGNGGFPVVLPPRTRIRIPLLTLHADGTLNTAVPDRETPDAGNAHAHAQAQCERKASILRCTSVYNACYPVLKSAPPGACIMPVATRCFLRPATSPVLHRAVGGGPALSVDAGNLHISAQRCVRVCVQCLYVNSNGAVARYTASGDSRSTRPGSDRYPGIPRNSPGSDRYPGIPQNSPGSKQLPATPLPGCSEVRISRRVLPSERPHSRQDQRVLHFASRPREVLVEYRLSRHCSDGPAGR